MLQLTRLQHQDKQWVPMPTAAQANANEEIMSTGKSTINPPMRKTRHETRRLLAILQLEASANRMTVPKTIETSRRQTAMVPTNTCNKSPPSTTDEDRLSGTLLGL